MSALIETKDLTRVLADDGAGHAGEGRHRSRSAKASSSPSPVPSGSGKSSLLYLLGPA